MCQILPQAVNFCSSSWQRPGGPSSALQDFAANPLLQPPLGESWVSGPCNLEDMEEMEEIMTCDAWKTGNSFLRDPSFICLSDKLLNASSRTIWLCHQNLKQHGICKGQKKVKKQNQKMFVIHTGWGPQDSVQLPYKWLNSMVYGRYNMIYNYS